MDLLEYSNPIFKEEAGDNDKVVMTDGDDVFVVPSGKAIKPVVVTDALGGMMACNEEAQSGKISIEDFIVAMVGVDAALKGVANKTNFENVYSAKFDYNAVVNKLNEKGLIPSDSKIESVEANFVSDYEITMQAIVNPEDIGVDPDNQTWTVTLYTREQEGHEWDLLKTAHPVWNDESRKFTCPFLDLKGGAGTQYYVELKRSSVGMFYLDLVGNSEILTVE